MSELVETGFLDFVKAKAEATALPCFANMHFYSSGEKGKFDLPACSFEMKESKQLPVDEPISEGTLTVWIETQADDEDEATHTARCKALGEWLLAAPDPQNPGRKIDQKKAVSVAITAAGKVKIFGYSPAGSSRELKDDQWTSGLDLAVGFMPLV